MPTKDYDFDNPPLEKCVFTEKENEAEELLITAIRGEVIRLHKEKSKRRQQQIREFISKSYEQLIEIHRRRQ
jgi:hypothetical protein